MNATTRSFALIAATGALFAVDPELRLGQDELVVDLGLATSQIDAGAVRSTGGTTKLGASARYFNIGVDFDMWMALEETSPVPTLAAGKAIRPGDLTEIRLRVDYLIEVPDVVQILPYFQYSWYPVTGTPVVAYRNGKVIDDYFNPFEQYDWDTNPKWLGVEAWFALPFEGIELGGDIRYDLTDAWKWAGAVGGRGLLQIDALDLNYYTLVHFGSPEYHQRLIGSDETGATVLDMGLKATLPLPWEYWFIYSYGKFNWWLRPEDRAALPASLYNDNGVWEAGVGIEFRLSPQNFADFGIASPKLW
jgi:hypothetical protein